MGGGKKWKEKRKRKEGGDIEREERKSKEEMGNVGIFRVVKKNK